MRRRLFLQTLTTVALTFSVLIASPGSVTAQTETLTQSRPLMRRPLARAAVNGSLSFARTELFFGTGKPDGTAVTEAEFFTFIDEQVTPRFPDGLTVLRAEGQFTGENGVIVKEHSFVLILLYPVEDFRASSRKINEIRRKYNAQFDQESVLRVDDPLAVRVSF